ncbi:hypothetical protein [Vibrio vulnificus]|uniref:hypothetical protein n=1 Tax=Vibrio vulnificus TaxID=672 RepID=UPI0009298C6D|nr:hypothetical protein [Vibrio vulnificus]EHZ7124165.1 hypothetical protein [Vibrio vulnificus]ELO5516983.1 hypothetical protein [Vibrio vulnificus]MCU8361311.1 hypothetical protein [Vibrio vulnificus]OJI30590.1 hypothetical protein VV99743_03379 [Vibrio vulnificus]
MGTEQKERWAKNREKGFARYVASNTISIVLAISLVRVAIYFAAQENASIEGFITEKSMNLVVTAIVLPFVFWFIWLYQESKYKRD